MIKALAIRMIVLGTAGVGAAYASAFRTGGAPTWGVWLFIVATAAVLMGTMALGALRGDGRPGERALMATFAAIFVLLVAGFGLALVLPADDPARATLWLGLPRRAAIVLYGIGVLPLFALPLAYAATFDGLTLRDADIERVRAARLDRGAAPADRGEVA